MSIDKPLKDIPTKDLQYVANDLMDAIFSASFCGLKALAERLKEIRAPLLAELQTRRGE